MRGAPQSGFASAMVRPRSASSEPTWSTHSPAAGLPAPESAEALPVPANHGLGANEVERLAPPRPPVGEPHPESSIEAPELRSLRSAAEQGELLPERQVFEREVVRVLSAARRAPNRASTRDIALHVLHVAGPSSRLGIEFWQTTSAINLREVAF